MSISPIERSVQTKCKVNFRTLQLVFPEPGVATFVRSRPLKLVLILVVVLPLVWLLIHFGFFKAFGWKNLFFELIPWATAAVAVIWYLRGQPLVFDKNRGRMWRRGKTDPRIGDFALLRDVEAVQVCSTMVSGIESRYRVFELNVVMKSPAGVRVPALCHGNRTAMYADAQKLAQFLGVPLLDHA